MSAPADITAGRKIGEAVLSRHEHGYVGDVPWYGVPWRAHHAAPGWCPGRTLRPSGAGLECVAVCGWGAEMTFIFDAPFARKSVSLSASPYMHPAMRDRIKVILEDGCYCDHDGARTATLRRRQVGGNIVVYLQCDACGSSLGSALSRQQHPNWQSYSLWDSALPANYEAAREAWRAQRLAEAAAPGSFPDMASAKEAYLQRARDYEEWCRTSPEWRDICKKIAWRSRGHCEACLNASAEVVHHLTYSFGKLPPAWSLKAVCRSCHDRLHDGSDEWCDDGMAR